MKRVPTYKNSDIKLVYINVINCILFIKINALTFLQMRYYTAEGKSSSENTHQFIFLKSK